MYPMSTLKGEVKRLLVLFLYLIGESMISIFHFELDVLMFYFELDITIKNIRTVLFIELTFAILKFYSVIKY